MEAVSRLFQLPFKRRGCPFKLLVWSKEPGSGTPLRLEAVTSSYILGSKFSPPLLASQPGASRLIVTGSLFQLSISGPWRCYFFFFLRATPKAHRCSQARDWIGVAPVGLHHSSSNARSKLHLQSTPQLMSMMILNPLSEDRDQTCVLLDSSQVCYCWAMTGTPDATPDLSVIKKNIYIYVYIWGPWYFGPCPWYVEVSRSCIKPIPQQWPEPQQWQHQILNHLGHQGTPSFPLIIYLYLLCVWSKRARGHEGRQGTGEQCLLDYTVYKICHHWKLQAIFNLRKLSIDSLPWYMKKVA